MGYSRPAVMDFDFYLDCDQIAKMAVGYILVSDFANMIFYV